MTPEEVADRLAIDDLVTRYASAVDERDWGMYRSCFTADALIDYSSAGGPKGGLDEITLWLEQALSGFGTTFHYVTNRSVTLSGDTARGRHAFYNPMQLGEGFMTAAGYYNHQYVRTASGWRIAELVEDLKWITTSP